MPVMFVFPRVLKINAYGLAIIVWDYMIYLCCVVIELLGPVMACTMLR